MKKLAPFIFVIMTLNVLAQIPSSCNVPPVLATDYDDDVHFLAMQRLYEIHSADTFSIIIPQVYKDSIWEGLAAIYNTSIPERDSVFCLYNVHQWMGEPPFFYQVNIGVDTSFGWTDQWQNLQTTTGYTQLDDFISQYGFTLQGYGTFSNSASLVTNQKINIIQFNDSLLTFTGILNTASSVAGDGDRILYSTNSNVRQYYFSAGCEDCPSGCIFRNTWSYSVMTDCSVLYNGASYGDYYCLPPNNCETIGVETSKPDVLLVSIYPNPTTTSLTIETTLVSSGTIQTEIKNSLGQIVYNFNEKASNGLYKKTIDLNLGQGIYFLTLQTDQGLMTKKIEIVK